MTLPRADRASRYLLLGILATLPLERIPSLELTDPVTVTVRISQILAVLLIAINAPLLWRKKADFLHAPWIFLVLFWVVCAASTVSAINTGEALSTLVFTVFVGLIAFIISHRYEPHRNRSYILTIIGSTIAACAFAVYQFFGDLAGLSSSWTGLRSQYTSAVFGFPRVQSTGLEPLYFDNFLLISLGICLVFLARKSFNWKWTALYAGIASVLIMNVSRGAMAALASMVIIAAIIAAAHKHYASAGRIVATTGLAFGLAVGLIAAGSAIASYKVEKRSKAVSNFTSQATNVNQGESADFRSASRKTAYAIWKDNLLLGVGPGNYGAAAHQREPKRYVNDAAIVNNEPLEVLAETGIAGALTLSLFALSLLFAGVKALRKKWLQSNTLFITAGLLTLAGIVVQYQTFSTLYITHIWVVIGLTAGAIAVQRRTTS